MLAAQLVQVAAPVVEKKPVLQLTQARRAVEAAKVPGGQAEQLTEPDPAV